MMTRLRVLVAGLVVLVVAGIIAACAAAAPFVQPLERDACVLLKAEAPSGAVDQVCADADMLAPYVADIIAMAAHKPAAAKLANSTTVIALPPPSHPVERRLCVLWAHLPDPPDGGRDGH